MDLSIDDIVGHHLGTWVEQFHNGNDAPLAGCVLWGICDPIAEAISHPAIYGWVLSCSSIILLEEGHYPAIQGRRGGDYRVRW